MHKRRRYGCRVRWSYIGRRKQTTSPVHVRHAYGTPVGKTTNAGPARCEEAVGATGGWGQGGRRRADPHGGVNRKIGDMA